MTHHPILAAAFCHELRARMTPRQMDEVVRRNALPEYAASCATHDFTDANMAMDEAFERIEGRIFDHENDMDAAALNGAWEIARRARFIASKCEPIGPINAPANFNPALVQIIRKRFSHTQGETLVIYNGQRLEQWGDDPEPGPGGVWRQRPDDFWIGIALRETLARGMLA